MRRAAPRAVAALALLAASGAAAQPATIALPRPLGPVPVPRVVFEDRLERLTQSAIPPGATIDDTERVEVLVAPDGVPSAVLLTQRLVLHGSGQFQIWERSSAQDVEALEDTVAPVLKREAVIWQGFVSGSKDLMARLTLDPAVERALLPLAVEVLWRGNGRIAPGGALPGPGEVTVRLTNRTPRPATFPTGDVAAKDLAGPLDVLLAHARKRTPAAPPAAGRGLPLTLPVSRVGAPRDATSVAPLRVTGSIRVEGAGKVPAEGAGSAPRDDGLLVNGVLQGGAEFVLRPAAAGTLVLDLKAVPTLDPRTLEPPRGRTWAEWLTRNPTPNEVRDATAALVEGAAAAARDDEYAPYLGHHGPGKVSTTYRIRMAPPELVPAVENPLRPKAFPIALALLALAAIAANGTVIWRRL